MNLYLPIIKRKEYSDMEKTKLQFEAKTSRITIDLSRCEPSIKKTDNPTCGFACVKACRLYGRNILKVENSKPVLAITEPADIKRTDNECLACEYACWAKGIGCISIEIPLAGIDEYKKKTL
jgi:hypothetical protein